MMKTNGTINSWLGQWKNPLYYPGPVVNISQSQRKFAIYLGVKVLLILDTAAVLLGRLFEDELCGGDECWVLVGPFIWFTLVGSAVLDTLPLAGGAGVALLEAAGSSSLKTSSSYIRYLINIITTCTYHIKLLYNLESKPPPESKPLFTMNF